MGRLRVFRGLRWEVLWFKVLLGVVGLGKRGSGDGNGKEEGGGGKGN